MILSPATYEIERQSLPGSYEYGQYVAGATRKIYIYGSLQPLSLREVELLPEGARTKARFALYCDKNQPMLKTTDTVGNAMADRLTWNNRQYLLFSHGEWQLHYTGLPHRQYILVEIGEDES